MSEPDAAARRRISGLEWGWRIPDRDLHRHMGEVAEARQKAQVIRAIPGRVGAPDGDDGAEVARPEPPSTQVVDMVPLGLDQRAAACGIDVLDPRVLGRGFERAFDGIDLPAQPTRALRKLCLAAEGVALAPSQPAPPMLFVRLPLRSSA